MSKNSGGGTRIEIFGYSSDFIYSCSNIIVLRTTKILENKIFAVLENNSQKCTLAAPQAVFKELAVKKEVVHCEGKDGELEYGKSHRKASKM